jgi:hypothetical protein
MLKLGKIQMPPIVKQIQEDKIIGIMKKKIGTIHEGAKVELIDNSFPWNSIYICSPKFSRHLLQPAMQRGDFPMSPAHK